MQFTPPRHVEKQAPRSSAGLLVDNTGAELHYFIEVAWNVEVALSLKPICAESPAIKVARGQRIGCVT